MILTLEVNLLKSDISTYGYVFLILINLIRERFSIKSDQKSQSILWKLQIMETSYLPSECDYITKMRYQNLFLEFFCRFQKSNWFCSSTLQTCYQHPILRVKKMKLLRERD